MTISNETLKTVASSFANASEEYRKKAVKYRKALEEIREYLQQFKKKKSNFYTLNDVITDIAGNIEKIISEIIGDKNNG